MAAIAASTLSRGSNLVTLAVVHGDRRLAVLPLAVVTLLVPAIIPAVGGRHDAEWLLGLAFVYLQLALVLGLVVAATRARWAAALSTSLGLLFGLGVALGAQLLINGALFRFYPRGLRFEGEAMPTLAEATSGAILFGFVAFGVWVLAIRYPQLVARDAARRAEAERLRALADRQQMQARLAPHFLLNTLNAVAGLLGEDPKAARRVLAALGELLRAALDPEQEAQHSVREEFQLLQSYAYILQARYGEERLRFEWALDDDAAECRLPCLLIQPLVENAVLHGALKSSAPSTVRVAAIRAPEGGGLRVEVDNDGTYDPAPRRGHGVALVEARVALLSGGGFDIDSRDGRTRAVVCFSKASS